MYLLDTNICIYLIKQQPRQVVQRIKTLPPSQVHLSVISLAELEYGAAKSQHRERNRLTLLHFVSAFDIVNFTDMDAEIFGIIRAGLESKGQVIGAYDMQIAAQAISRELILVTNNTAEFTRIPNLKLENWV